MRPTDFVVVVRLHAEVHLARGVDGDDLARCRGGGRRG